MINCLCEIFSKRTLILPEINKQEIVEKIFFLRLQDSSPKNFLSSKNYFQINFLKYPLKMKTVETFAILCDKSSFSSSIKINLQKRVRFFKIFGVHFLILWFWVLNLLSGISCEYLNLALSNSIFSLLIKI